MHKLTFNLADVEREIALAEAGEPNDYYGDARKGLWLVGDDGIYLMSNHKRADGGSINVVHAEGLNPSVDGRDVVWDRKRMIFGGDDGVEVIALEDAKRWVAGAKKRSQPLVIEMDPNGYALVIWS